MKTASGIPYWPSRDPIGEDGGANLYEFVGNDGVNWVDLLGLVPPKNVEDALKQLKDLLPEMKKQCDCCVNPEKREKCKEEASAIIDAISGVWKDNYKGGAENNQGDFVGGHLCFSWANGFGTVLANLAIKNKKGIDPDDWRAGRKLEVWEWDFRYFSKKPLPGEDRDVNSRGKEHFAIKVLISNASPQNEGDTCKGYSFDDGYLGGGVTHDNNEWPAKEIVGEDEHTPWLEGVSVRPGVLRKCTIGGKP